MGQGRNMDVALGVFPLLKRLYHMCFFFRVYSERGEMRHLTDYAAVLYILYIYSFFGFIFSRQGCFKDICYNWDVGSSDSPVVWVLISETSTDCVR